MPKGSLQATLAVVAGKLSAQLIRLFHIGSGTSLPGKVALKLDPNLLGTLGQQVTQKTVAITGTNGKSTTAGLLAAWIEAGGSRVIHNQLGANMVPGITAALLQQSSILGRLNADYGVIEVDEASMTKVSQSLKQSLTLVTNLFRDQLDRYGELDTTAKMIDQGIRCSEGYLALNADDPMVASIGRHFSPDQVVYYGVETVHYPNVQTLDFPVGFPKEVMDCPICAAALIYDHTFYGHLGHYHCSACDFRRPTPWVSATHIDVGVMESQITLRLGETSLPALPLKLPGLFNAYNLLAAATAGFWLGQSLDCLPQSVNAYHSIFGRAEHRQIQGKPVTIFLIKNPIGATEVLKVVTADPKAHVVIMINDNYADGRDISWLWDAPFEYLSTLSTPIVVSGHRAEDMAVRLRYAGVSESLIQQESVLEKALQQALDQTPADHHLYVLPTYTALLDLSQLLKSR